MYSGLFNRNKYITIHVDLIKILGSIESTVYYSEISTIKDKAIEKNKINKDGFIKLDRKYIQNKTTINIEKQLQFDKAFESINLINIDEKDVSMIKLNEGVIYQLLESDDKIKEEVSLQLNPKKYMGKENRKSSLIEHIKSNIVCDDQEILFELKRYVDSAAGLDPKKGEISLGGFQIFQEELTKYANGDKNLLIGLIRTGAEAKSLDSKWTIIKYLKLQKEMQDLKPIPQKSEPMPLDKSRKY